MTLTQWFYPYIKPVHIGWYHTGLNSECPINNKSNEAALCWWWDGWLWRIAPNLPRLDVQDRYWRGIAK